MKRFWKDVASLSDEDGWRIELDGRPVRTPARVLLRLPTEQLAAAVTAEWQEAGETVDPRAMPLTGLANAAIDRIAPEQEAFAASLARYGASDLLCYRADSPTLLIERQAAHWDPLLLWARRRYDFDVVVTSGVAPVEQSADMLAKLHQAVAVLGPFELAGLSPIVTVGGSVIAALAFYEQAFDADAVWAAVSLDEAWQLDQWGHDAEAEKALAAREADFRAGARFLELIA